MRVLFLAFILSALLNSCQKNQEKDFDENDNKQKALYHLLEKFSLPHRKNLATDGNSFLFIKSKPWDTSFVLILQKYPDRIRGVYYQTTTSYHRDLDDYLNKEDELLYFEGFSFNIDTLRWKDIIYMSKELELNSNSLKDAGCVDCGTYVLSHNDSKARFSDGSDKDVNDNFIAYENFLKKKLLFNAFKKKLPLGARSAREMREEKSKESQSN